MRTLTTNISLCALLMTSKFNVSLADADAKTCAEESHALMKKDEDALLRATITMMKSYNETCKSRNLCTVEMSEDTSDYFVGATNSNADPSLPDFPIVASMDGNFLGFTSDSHSEYKNLCLREGGRIKHVDIDFKMKGTAMDLVDLNVELKVDRFPACLTSSCEDVDLEKAFEEAVKIAALENAAQISEQQKAVLSGMDVNLACAAAGIEECVMIVVDSDAPKSGVKGSAQEDMSGISFLTGRFASISATVLSLWAIV